MKRKADFENKDGIKGTDVWGKRPTRQDPVSCQTCRAKKLKCDRNRPCSNCSTRRVPCIYGTGAVQPSNYQNPVLSGGRQEVVSVEAHQDSHARPPPPPSHTTRPSRENSEQWMTADWLEKIVMGHQVPGTLPATLKERLMPAQQARDASNSGQRNTAASGGSSQLPAASRGSYYTDHGNGLASVKLTSFLPEKPETISLFKYYELYIDWLYHIIVPRRVMEQINDIYQCIDSNSPVNPNYLALVFSILAVAFYFRPPPGGFAESHDYAASRCREYRSLAGAALVQSNYIAHPTIEGLQATIIISRYLPNINADPSVRALFVHGTMVSQAKNLMLHCVDSPRCWEERRANGFDAVELEIKRRLWWDLAAYDWLLGFLSGPQERTYLIQPKHMRVDFPLNIDDDAIQPHGNDIGRPPSIPTTMSYTIERLKLAILCREIVDETAMEHFHGLEPNYDKILDLDRRLHQAYKELPDFFRLDSASRRRHAQLYRERPTLAWQRCIIQQGFHSRLCRLHRDYFIRGARDPTYSYSHVICLQSARKVLEIKRIMDEEEPIFMPNSSIVWSTIHHVFMAAVMLLLDVCFNWDDILADKRREEVLEACRMLSKAQQASSIVRDGINAMMGVLQKYWPQGKQPSVQEDAAAVSTPLPTSVASTSAAPLEGPGPSDLPTPETGPRTSPIESKAPAASFPGNNVAVDQSVDRELEEIWSELLDSGVNLASEPPDWTDLLTELTNATIPCE